MNIQKIMKNVNDIDKKIIKIMKYGIKSSFIFCILAGLILITYIFNSNPTSYYIGISLFKSSLFYIVGFIICGIAFNNIMKDIL